MQLQVNTSEYCQSSKEYVILYVCGAVAQLGERLNGIQEVVGSIPISSTISFFKIDKFQRPARLVSNIAGPNVVRVVGSLLKDDTEFYKQFVQNESFKRFVTDMVVNLTAG